VFQDLPTILQQWKCFASTGWEKEIVESVPIMQPVYNLWHFLNQKYTVGAYRISSEDPDSLSRDPLLDVVENRPPNGVVGMR